MRASGYAARRASNAGMATTKSPMPFARSTTMLRTSSTRGPTGPSAPRLRAAGSAMTSGGSASSLVDWVMGALTVGLLRCRGRRGHTSRQSTIRSLWTGHGASISCPPMLVALWSNRGGLVHGVCGRRQGVSVFVAAAAFALAACSGGSAGPGSATSSSSTTATVPGPSTSLTPEQQAAEEAKQALLSYHEVVDSVYQAGGQDPQMRLAAVATGNQLDFLMQDARRLRQNHWRQVGSSSITNIQVKSVQQSETPQVKLSFCLDARKT